MYASGTIIININYDQYLYEERMQFIQKFHLVNQ